MARKKQEGITTTPRFAGKMYAVGVGIFSGNVARADKYADALAESRAAGFEPYREAYTQIKPVLARNNVPSTLWGLYRSFACEIVHRVRIKREVGADEIVSKWQANGLDAGVLGDCADALVGAVAAETPQPAQKAA